MLPEILLAIESDWQFSRQALMRSINETRKAGHALIHNRVTAGVSALGINFCDLTGRTMGAVSIAAVNDRLNARRISALTLMLRRAVRQIEDATRGNSLLGNY